MALYAVHAPRLETKGRDLQKGECIQKAMRSGDRHEDREEEERAERRRRGGGAGHPAGEGRDGFNKERHRRVLRKCT